MIFWIVAGLLTLLTIGVTILPVFSKTQTPNSSLEYDKEIYKARLEEIERELSLGSISEKQYQYTLAEEGRRFLALASSDSIGKSGQLQVSRHPALIGAMAAIVMIPLITIVSYTKLGSLNSPDQPLQARLSADPRGQNIEVLLQRAENQLAKNPDDGRGWAIVAPVYLRLGRPEDAVTAYRNAIRVSGPTSELRTSLGEALTLVAGGIVPEEAIKLFRKAAASNAEAVKPKFFLGIAHNQSGEYDTARDVWNSLIDKAPDNAPWLNVARQQLQVAESNLGTKAPGNPSAEDVEAASQLSTADRQEFINSMVERLAGELEENPQNKPGWQRIIRSYTVLGRKAEALGAIKKAQQLFKDDKKFIEELQQNLLALNK